MDMRVLLAVVGLSLGATASVGAVDDQISDPGIRQAIAVARQLDPVRTAFHARYAVALGDPTFDRVEVITEYRRVVMMAEEQLKVDTLWGITKAKPGLAPYRGLVSFVLLIKFPQLNVSPLPPQVTPLPKYELILYPKGIPPPPAKPEILRLTPVSETMLFPAGSGSVAVGPLEKSDPRNPSFKPGRLEPGPGGAVLVPPPSQPQADPSLKYGGGSAMSGVRIEGAVPLSTLDLRGRLIVGLLLDGKEQRQLVFNLASLR